MTLDRLLNLLPTLIVVAFAGYSVYSTLGIIPVPAAGRSIEGRIPNGTPRETPPGSNSGGAAAMEIPSDQDPRDPFHIRPSDAPPAIPSGEIEEPPPPGPDPLAAIVEGLTLDATLLQGSDQLAIIDGRIYHKGQHLVLDRDSGDPGASGKPESPLLVAGVLPAKVILRAGGRNYELGYPDTFGRKANAAEVPASGEPALAEPDGGGTRAILQALLNSAVGGTGQDPTGRMGRSRTGTQARSSSGSTLSRRRPGATMSAPSSRSQPRS